VPDALFQLPMSDARVWQETAGQDTPAEPNQLAELEMPVTPVTHVTLVTQVTAEATHAMEPLVNDASVSPEPALTNPPSTSVVQSVLGEKRHADKDEVRDNIFSLKYWLRTKCRVTTSWMFFPTYRASSSRLLPDGVYLGTDWRKRDRDP